MVSRTKNKGVKVTTSTQLTHKRNKRKLSTSGEESDELRKGSENLTLKKVKKCSWICEDDEATPKDDEAILDDTDDEVEVLSQPSTSSESDGESSDDEVCVAVNKISSVLFKKKKRQKAELEDCHHVMITTQCKTTKRKADNILTIFTDQHVVKFSHDEDHIETVKGCWCEICLSVIDCCVTMQGKLT